MPSSVNNLLKSEFEKLTSVKRVWMAYSGGVDSHVLLHALVKLQQNYRFNVGAIHVNHGLNVNADLWEKHCNKVCSDLGIDCQILKVNVEGKKKESPEEAARTARYSAFKTRIQEGEYLVTAHHSDDQAETFLLHLLRGSGTRGLSGMKVLSPLGNGFLWRPLLSLPRDVLIKYAVLHELRWIDDDSNTHLCFDRNYLRHSVFTSLKARWPYVVKAIAQSTQHCADAEQLLQQLAIEDLETVAACDNSLDLSKLQKLSLTRRHNVLRYWLKQSGFPLPGRVHLDQFEHHFMYAEKDANPKLCWFNVQLRRYLNTLHALPHPYVESVKDRFLWKIEEALTLPFGIGTLVAKQKVNTGIRCESIRDANRFEVRFRQGGELIRLAGDGHTRTLKKWFQDLKIPRWERGRIPLLYIDGELAQALVSSHRTVAKQFAAGTGEMGWEIQILDGVPEERNMNESCNSYDG